MSLFELIPHVDYIAGRSGYQWSDQGAKEGMKGLDLDYTKILKFVVNMDFVTKQIGWIYSCRIVGG